MQDHLMPAVAKPAHVPDDRVADFDVYCLPGYQRDVQLALRAYQQAQPDIFWTPWNGGHWVATRAADIEAIQRNTARYSSKCVAIPKLEGHPQAIPIEVDPPLHATYRMPLTLALTPKRVNELDAHVRALAVGLIESFIADGECEFLDAFGRALPLSIFLDLVDLPRDDRHVLAPIADAFVRGRSKEVKYAAYADLVAYLTPVIQARQREPGDDLLSLICKIRVEGEPISFDAAIRYATVVMFGGLDTVASMMGFFALHLATDAANRHALTARLADQKFLENAIEEMMRRHGVINTCRVVTEDHELNGVAFRADDVILLPNALYGLDERQTPDPTAIDFDRCPVRHATFNFGPHICPGASLARRELRIFLEEWLSRIPEFQVKPGTTPVLETGMVNGIARLELSWPVR